MFERGTETGGGLLVKWIIHCEYIIKRSSKRLYILRQLRKAGSNDLIEMYCCLIRPVLEYAVPVWASPPSYLRAEIEALKIILDPGTIAILV